MFSCLTSNLFTFIYLIMPFLSQAVYCQITGLEGRIRSSLFCDITQCSFIVCLLTFQDSLPVPSSSLQQCKKIAWLLKMDDRLSRNVGK
jgi:hypothetical protein